MPLTALIVDLPRGAGRRHLPEPVARDYVGGRGVIAWLLQNRLPPDTAPLAPENALVFAAGPLAGTDSYATGGFVVGTRSPLTGAIGYGWAQGHWGAALRQSGIDLVSITGQAEDWIYLQIDPDRVRMRPATHLVGMSTRETTQTLRQELGPEYRIVCVGPAAEAGVAYATMVAEGRYMAEPAGAGVVMANKKIKAIAVRSGAPLPAADPRRLQVAMEIIRRRVESSALAVNIRQRGSAYFLTRAVALGALTHRNGKDGQADERLIHLNAAWTQHGVKQERGCAGCPMPCYFDHVRPDGSTTPRPELETVAGFARCGITEPNDFLRIAELCLDMGLDPATTSASLALMMECQEEGLAHNELIPWGDTDAILDAMRALGERRERRDVLSLGVGEMQEIFWGSSAFAPQAKGLAMPGLDPRALNGIALAMATSAIGGDYRYAMSYEELIDEPPSWIPEEATPPDATKGKALRLIWHERFTAILDSIGVCRRLGLMAYQISPAEMMALAMAATGVAYTPADIVKTGERIITVERLFARNYADNGALDVLPTRWIEEPLQEGNAAGRVPPVAEMVAEYYRRHGWDLNGDPTPERLRELGLEVPQ